MKQRIWSAIIAVLVIGVVTLLSGVSLVHAQKFETGNNPGVPVNETVNGSYYGAGRSITIAGTVDGDVICGTQTLNVSGTVHGDVICAAQSVMVTGTVDGNVRLAGQTITLDGKVGRNISAVGQSLMIGGRATVGGDVSFAGSSLTIDGIVGRDVASATQEITVSNRIGRNLEATTSQLTFTSGAVVNGTAHYTSMQKAAVAPGAKVANLQQSVPAQPNKQPAGSWGWGITAALLSLLALLFSSLILVLIMPRLFWTTSDEVLARPWWVLLAGFVAAIGLPVVLVITFISVIGIPLAVVLLFTIILLTLLSFPVSAFWLGRLLFGCLLKWTDNAIYLMLLGVSVLVILLAVPFLDIVVWFLAIWLGLGSLLFSFWRHIARSSYHQPQPIKVSAKRVPI